MCAQKRGKKKEKKEEYSCKFANQIAHKEIFHWELFDLWIEI